MSPLQKGALVVIDATSGQKSTISFQFNPTRLGRSLQPQIADNQGAQGRAEPVRFTGTPIETFSLEIQLDGSDQLPGFTTFSGDKVGSGDTLVAENGISPQLALLEMIVYPPSSVLEQEDSLLDNGTIEIAPKLAPLVLVSWGKNRLIPVQIQKLDVTEEAFDANLNPVRATVRIDLRVLGASDLSPSDKAYPYYMAYQKWKEKSAQLGAAWRYGS